MPTGNICYLQKTCSCKVISIKCSSNCNSQLDIHPVISSFNRLINHVQFSFIIHPSRFEWIHCDHMPLARVHSPHVDRIFTPTFKWLFPLFSFTSSLGTMNENYHSGDVGEIGSFMGSAFNALREIVFIFNQTHYKFVQTNRGLDRSSFRTFLIVFHAQMTVQVWVLLSTDCVLRSCQRRVNGMFLIESLGQLDDRPTESLWRHSRYCPQKWLWRLDWRNISSVWWNVWRMCMLNR